MKMKMLVIEDETAATVNLLSIISKVCPGAEIVGTIESVTEAVRWFSTNPLPDVVFMDIHLADGDAFRIFEQAQVNCPVIFTTAYDRYALDAFKVNSVDYLLKPIKAEDVRRAIDKLALLSHADIAHYSDRVSEMAAIRNHGTFLVHVRDKIIPVRAEEIAYCHTSDERVTIHTFDGRDLPFDKALDAMMSHLSPEDFFRANRQFIISREAIADISVWFGSRLSLNLRMETPERIVISKARVPEFKSWLAG